MDTVRGLSCFSTYQTHDCRYKHGYRHTPEDNTTGFKSFFKCIRMLPSYFKAYVIPCKLSDFLRNVQQTCLSLLPLAFKEIGRRITKYKAPSNWNSRAINTRELKSLRLLKCSWFSVLNMPCSGLSWHCLFIVISY